MAVTWDVVSLDVTKSVGSLSDVVTSVHWTASDSDGEHTGLRYGSVGLEAPGESFVEWADITESTAVGWAKAAIGADEVTAIEASIDAQITKSKTPTTGSGVSW